MAGGGITRLGYQEGGMDQMMMEPQMQEQMMQPPMQEQMMQLPMDQQMMQPSMDQASQIDPSKMDPKQALEIIIQMLIAQGIPPEQAREIALQMVQAVSEGGMNEMSDERIGARFGGSINNGREQYGLGSIFKGAAKAVSGVVSGVTNAVKSVAKSDLGKLALTAAALYYAPMAFGPAGTSAGLTGYQQLNIAPSIFGTYGDALGLEYGTKGFIPSMLSGDFTGGIKSLLPSSIGDLASKYGTSALISGAAGALGGALAGGVPQQNPGESNEDYQTRVNQYKLLYQQGVSNPQLSITNAPMNLYPNNPFYAQRRAEGGRIGYQEGGIGDLIKQTTQEAFFGNNMLAAGGVPTRKNPAGITELDYRKKGGYVPPIGIKEKADDIPAMLSNNEFVFTADAVRNAGNGSVNKGAERMYGLMKQLEAGGMV